MYGIFRKFMPPRLAYLLTAIWFFVLILLAVYFSFEPKAEFRYLSL